LFGYPGGGSARRVGVRHLRYHPKI
jgi:hypothetical protein